MDRVDIIIPIYNQRDKLIYCLSSIAMQSISDLCDITLINDSSDEDYSDIINFFQQAINIIEIKINNNKGPGYARQLGLSITKNPFIIFIDADDTFENAYSLEFLYGLMVSKEKPVAVFSSFVEECSNNKKKVHSKDNTWLFGKIYSRDFLNRNKIEFLDSRANEDKGFNCQVMLCSQKASENNIKYIDRITYCWKWNKSSITRKDNFSYRKKDLYGFVDNTLFAIGRAKLSSAPEDAIKKQSVSTMVYLYFRYLENLKTNDYLREDFLTLAKKFYDGSYCIDGIKLQEQKENQQFKLLYLIQLETFLKRKIILNSDINNLSFESFLNYLK